MGGREIRELKNEILNLRMENYHLRQEVSKLNERLLEQACAMERVKASAFEVYDMTLEAIGRKYV